jgi:acyl-CoA reductase-like NAD-dependent aldehyde dehydrogenase
MPLLLDNTCLPLQWVQGHGDPLPYYTSSHDGSGIDIPPLHAASVDEVDETVSDAQAALEGGWSRTSGGERAALLHRLADLITQHANEIAYYESLCSGVPLSFATMSIPLVVQVFRCKLRVQSATAVMTTDSGRLRWLGRQIQG